MLLLTEVPARTRTITTGTIAQAPLNLYLTPLLYEKQVYGVLELAAFTPFEAQHQAFIKEASDLVAAGLYAALQQERIHLLLAQFEAMEVEKSS